MATVRQIQTELNVRAVEVTADNIAAVQQIKRDEGTRLRRYLPVAADSPICQSDPGYAGQLMLRDMPASEPVRIGDWLVRQYSQVG